MSKQDFVSEYLVERGCPTAIVKGGLAGLVEQWEALVAEVETGYSLGLDDYLNELDVRQLLADLMTSAPEGETKPFTQRLQAADQQFLSLTKPTEACLWGEAIAEEEHWSADNNFWYYRRPRQGDPDFLAEINDALAEYE